MRKNRTQENEPDSQIVNGFGNAPGWIHKATWVIFGFIFFTLLILYYLYRETDIWSLWLDSDLKSRGPFAERVRGGIFRTRANTWSNLGYILVGLYILSFAWWDVRRATSDKDSYVVRFPAMVGLFGVACIILGLGSGLMHASMMPFGHKMDVFGMFFLFIALIALQWARWFPYVSLSKKTIPTWPMFGSGAIIVSAVLMSIDRRELGGDIAILGTLLFLMGVGVCIDLVKRSVLQQYRWLILAIITLAVAGCIQRLDVERRFTNPDTWFQGHAIWHILTAVSFGSIAYFYRMEVPTSKSRSEPLIDHGTKFK